MSTTYMPYLKGKKMGSKAQFTLGRSAITCRVGIQPQLNNYINYFSKQPNTPKELVMDCQMGAGGRILIAYQFFT